MHLQLCTCVTVRVAVRTIYWFGLPIPNKSPLPATMDDSVASAERSLNISDAYHDRDFCSGEKESIASCALYLHQVQQL